MTTSSTSQTKPISSYFSVKRTLPASQKEAPPIKKRMIACAGLNDKTWVRPWAQLTIQNCIKHSPSPYHSEPPCHKVCQELFGTPKESKLDQLQFEKLIKSLESRLTWFIKLHDMSSGIFLTNFEQRFAAHADEDNLLFPPCLTWKKNHLLLKAINTEYASEDLVRFIANQLMHQDLFYSTLLLHEEICLLNKSLEKQSTKGNKEF